MFHCIWILPEAIELVVPLEDFQSEIEAFRSILILHVRCKYMHVKKTHIPSDSSPRFSCCIREASARVKI